ncbi:MAG: hypothetical protein K2X29_06310, partial [Candidatus Obscuribacterales bacterium]|nr:hypothetical protein [Candidatus Obscuribacterales bacterium]
MDSASQHLPNSLTNFAIPAHDQNLSLEGLDGLFTWASDMVADGQDPALKQVSEQKLRRRVLEVVQQAREQKVATEAGSEVSYLQRRVMALLNGMTSLSAENAELKQIILLQTYAMQAIPELETEVKRLLTLDGERQHLEATQESLMNTISKIKIERDILDDLLRAVELENDRIGRKLNEARDQV